MVGTVEEITFSFVSVRLRDLRRLILPVTYFLERPFTNWTRTSAESLTSFSLVLSLDASLAAIRKQVDTILHAAPLWKGGKWEVMISELGESSMVVRITLGAPDPEMAFQLKSHVQERILDYLNRFKKGSLIGAVADPKPPMELAQTTNPPKLDPARPASQAELRGRGLAEDDQAGPLEPHDALGVVVRHKVAEGTGAKSGDGAGIQQGDAFSG